MEEYREQLEQLESYQSQELAKVKHMLLSAEAELETEKKKNLIQLHDTSGLAKIDFRQSEVQNSSNDQVTSSDFKLNGDGGGSDIDSEELSKLKRDNQVLQSKLVDVMSDRDAMKANLLELEIANHECDQVKFNQIEALKVEISKLQAEIETLNATLNVRNGEIRAKKEDLKREKVNTMKVAATHLYCQYFSWLEIGPTINVVFIKEGCKRGRGLSAAI